MTPLKPPFALSPSHPFALSLSKSLPRTRYEGPRSPSRHSCEGRNPEVRGRGASPVPVRPDATRRPPLSPIPSFPRRREPHPLHRPFVMTPLKLPFALSLSKSLPRTRYGGPKPTAVNA